MTAPIVDGDVRGITDQSDWKEWMQYIADDVVDLLIYEHSRPEILEMSKDDIDEFVRETPALSWEPWETAEYVGVVSDYAANAHSGTSRTVDLVGDDVTFEMGTWVEEIIHREVADHVEIELESRGYPMGETLTDEEDQG